MWLDELDDLRRSLQRRINDHYEALVGSESTVRYALVNPLLSALGWDLADPKSVRTEYRVEKFVQKDGKWKSGILDYVLLDGQRRRLVVEAKALGKSLDDEAVEQCISYCVREGPGHFVVTNGKQWRGYYLHAPGGASQNQDFDFDITTSSTMELLWLWPGNFREARAKPIPVVPVPDGNKDYPPVPKPSGTPLPDVPYKKGMTPPRRLILPDGMTKELPQSWASVQVATAEWLIDRNHVKNLPLCNDNKTHLLHRKPTRRDGKNFVTPKEVRKNHWIEMNCGPKYHLKKAMELLSSCDIDPKTVYLELD